jgi:hypothetical protein
MAGPLMAVFRLTQKDIKREAKMHLELGNHLVADSMLEGRNVPVTTGSAGNLEPVISVPSGDAALPFAMGRGWDPRNRSNR